MDLSSVPYLVCLFQAYYVDHWLPIVVYGAFALAAAFTDIFLPETKGRPLPETMADTLNLAKG